MNKSSHDWATIEQAFINGNKKLIEYSREKTGFAASPPYNSLRKRAGQHNWSSKRAETKALADLVPMAPEKREAISSLNNDVAKLVDASSVILDHLKLSRSLKGFYAALGVKVQAAIASLDAEDMTPETIVRALSVMSTLINSATDLERKSLGLAEPLQSVEILTRYVISRDVEGQLTEEDVRPLTRDEWHEKYGKGNDQN